MDFESFNVRYSHFESICRFCLKRDLFLKPIFPEEDDETDDDFASNDEKEEGSETVVEMIENCTGMKLSSDDKLPKFMCSSCLNELQKCNQFRQKCLKSNTVLEETLKKHESGLDNDNTDDLFDMYDIDNTENYQAERYHMETQLNEDELKEIDRMSNILFSSSSSSITTSTTKTVSSIELETSSKCAEPKVKRKCIDKQDSDRKDVDELKAMNMKKDSFNIKADCEKEILKPEEGTHVNYMDDQDLERSENKRIKVKKRKIQSCNEESVCGKKLNNRN